MSVLLRSNSRIGKHKPATLRQRLPFSLVLNIVFVMQYCRLFFLLCVLLCCPRYASAIGQLSAQHITMANGLPSNVVYDVYEDSRGFIWFCTDQGISRYDGSAFRNYSIKDGIPDREVFRIREDKQQRYWLICYNRKACYLKYGKVYTSENDALCRQIEAENLSYDDLFTDRNGNDCLVGKKIGILRQWPPYLVLRERTGAQGGRLRHFRINGDDCIMDGSGIYNINTGFYQEIDHTKVSFYDGRSLFFSAFGGLGQGHKLCQWQLRGDRFYLVNELLIPDYLYQIGPYEKDGMKLCTTGGILVYDSLSQKMVPDAGFPAGVSANNMRIDSKGNRWLSTLNEGVYFIPVNGGQRIDQNSGLVENNITSIALSKDGDILAGDDDGRVYRIKKNTTMQIYTLTPPKRDNRVLFVRDNGHGLLVVGSDAGLFAIDRNNVSAIQVAMAMAMKAGVFSESHFYAGHSGGLIVYDSNTRKVRNLLIGLITALTVDSNRVLWTGGADGLSYYIDGRPQKYNQDSLLASSFITCIAPAPGGGILAGSSTRGLFVVKDHRQPPVRLDIHKGLAGNSCKQIFVSANGCIWLCSDGGVDRILQTADGDFIIKSFPLPLGLTGNQINDLTESDGLLYLATAEGILALNSRDMLQSEPPRLYIESVNGNAFSGQPLQFSYKERNLQIAYTGLSYSGGTPLQYKYLLAGGTDDTLYTYARTIDFSALSPGAYNLLLWCRSPGSQWTAKPLQLSFTILPPFWRHPVLIGAFLLFAVSIVLLLFRFRINKIRRRATLEARSQQQLAELEMNALRAQINPHFIFNALNAIQFYYSRNDEITANHYMTSFAHFIRLTLTHSQAHWLPLSEEIAMLRTYLELEQIRFQHSFGITVDVAPCLTAEQVAIPAMLIQPYVENAINHGLRYLKERQGELTLSFTLKQDSLCCIVEDNGIGRAEASTNRQSQHSSMGMKITNQRIETINRMYSITISADIIDKQDAHGKAGGTRVSLLIPLKLINHDSDYTNC